MGLSRHTLRKQMRQARKSLSPEQQHNASWCLMTQFCSLPEIAVAKHLACYLSTDGEINTHPVIEYCWKKGITVYLPVLHPFSKGHLLFLQYDEDTQLVTNHYGISEPKLQIHRLAPLSKLDVICTPLVAFDRQGQRLGMGGGYYDRTLAAWQQEKTHRISLGLAHDCQCVDGLPVEAWDMPLSKILTPSTIWSW